MRRSVDHMGSYAAPLVTSLVLCAGLIWWSSGEWRSVGDQHRAQLRRFSDGFMHSFGVATRHLVDTVGADHPQVEVMLRDLAYGPPEVAFALVLVGDRQVARAGEVPERLPEIEGSAGEAVLDRTIVIWRRMVERGAPRPGPGLGPLSPGADRLSHPAGRDLPPPPSYPRGSDLRMGHSLGKGEPPGPRPGGLPAPHPGGPRHPRAMLTDGANPTLVLGLHDTIPPPELQRALRDLGLRAGLGLLAILTLTAAWIQSIRGRLLQSRLRLETSRREHLEELSLAAAGLAHETKNPLGVIRGLAQSIAAETTVPAPKRTQAEEIVDAADQAAERLGGFLSYARQRAPELQVVAAGEVIHKAVTVLEPDFEAAGVTVEATGGGDSNESSPGRSAIVADPEMLLQILVNLLLNSLQASESGSTVGVEYAPRGSTASIAVRDEGCGVPDEMLSKVFKPYVSGRPGGHGLGLAIVKRLAEEQGWTVDVESPSGRGTTVRIEGIAIAGRSAGRAGSAK